MVGMKRDSTGVVQWYAGEFTPAHMLHVDCTASFTSP
jgi:hypothetical protein